MPIKSLVIPENSSAIYIMWLYDKALNTIGLFSLRFIIGLLPEEIGKHTYKFTNFEFHLCYLRYSS